MTDGYDGNGDYGYGDEESDYKQQKRNVGNGGGNSSTGGGGPHNGDHHHEHHGHHHAHHHHGGGAGGGSGNGNGGGGGSEGILNEKANEYVRDCLTEKSRMDRKFPIAERLMDSEIEKVQSTGRIPMRELKYADIYREKPMRLSQKVLVPVREHPKFNFVGKLLGPKGNSLRRLQEETLCKMTVLGRGSMRDRAKEEELRVSKDPKYAHLSSDLHVEISTIAPPAEAYARIAYAMAELRKYLIPDSNDVIRQEQLRELMDHTGNDGTNVKGTTAMASYKRLNAHTQGGAGGMGVGGSGTAITGGVVNKSHQTHHGGYRAITQQTQSYNKNVNAPKQKVLSILEKARTAMDETYGRGYEEHAAYEQHSSYDPYALGPNTIAVHGPHIAASSHANMTTSIVGGTARTQNYEQGIDYDAADYNRRGGTAAGSEYYHQHSPGYANSINTVSQGGQVPGANHNRGHVNR